MRWEVTLPQRATEELLISEMETVPPTNTGQAQISDFLHTVTSLAYNQLRLLHQATSRESLEKLSLVWLLFKSAFF